MKLVEFVAIAPRCIVCNSIMTRTITAASTPATNPSKKKYYNVNMQCSRAEQCFGYMSNAVSIHDPIVVKKFYIGFPRVQLFVVVDEFTQIQANGAITKTQYIPLDTWVKAKGQVLEKIQKLLPLVD